MFLSSSSSFWAVVFIMIVLSDSWVSYWMGTYYQNNKCWHKWMHCQITQYSREKATRKRHFSIKPQFSCGPHIHILHTLYLITLIQKELPLFVSNAYKCCEAEQSFATIRHEKYFQWISFRDSILYSFFISFSIFCSPFTPMQNENEKHRKKGTRNSSPSRIWLCFFIQFSISSTA